MILYECNAIYSFRTKISVSVNYTRHKHNLFFPAYVDDYGTDMDRYKGAALPTQRDTTHYLTQDPEH